MTKITTAKSPSCTSEGLVQPFCLTIRMRVWTRSYPTK